MTLAGPVLDDRTYEQLRAELVARIPVYAPEWTDHNPTDPGIALLELFAYLGESLLFRFNQIPDATKVAFLRLLGRQPRPARPAETLLALETDRPEGVQVLRGAVARAGAIPFHTTNEVYVWPLEAYAVGKMLAPSAEDEVAADPAAAVLGDRERERRVARETKRRLDAVARATGSTQTRLAASTGIFSLALVPMDPLGPEPALDVRRTVDGSLWVALLARTPVLRPSVTAALGSRTLFLGLAFDETIEPPPATVPATGVTALGIDAAELTADPLPVLWELWQPGDASMSSLAVDGDTTRGLATTGVVTLTLPPRMPVLDPAVEPSGDWDVPPPLDDDELTQRLVCWLRARRPAGSNDSIRSIRWVGMNSVEAVQSEPAAAELLGVGTGDPGQSFTLSRRPVVPGSVRLEVEGVDGWQGWSTVDTLAASQALDAHYVLDPVSGRVTFGGGDRGRAPQLGQRIRVLGYDVGGGLAGNVPAGAVNALSDVGSVKVRNPLGAAGGADAASLVEALADIPILVHRRDRAVVGEDFRALALEVPGVARAEVLSTFHPDTPDHPAAGVVSVVVFPGDDLRDPAAPEPDLALLRRVAVFLDARRLLTTELYVLPPSYRRIAVSISVRVRRGYQVDAVRRWVEQILRQYLAPLPDGGPEGAGWPLGQAVRRAELEAVAVQVEGVESIEGDLRLAVRDGGAWTDVEREVTLRRWEVPAVDVVTVVHGPEPAPAAGTGYEPPPRGGKPDVLVPLPPDVC
jgi:hypothetical protein